MRRALAVILILVLPPTPAEPVALLIGNDPAQFERVGLTPESISIIDGEIRLTGKPLGYFATKREYKEFVLTFEYKYDRPEALKSDADFRGNSGLLLHLAGPAKVWPTCVQVQLAQFDPGAIFPLGDARCGQAGSDPAAQKAAVKPVGEWNQLRVTARGGMIQSVLNGVEVARASKVEPDHGALAWQSEGKPVRFRNLRIEERP